MVVFFRKWSQTSLDIKRKTSLLEALTTTLINLSTLCSGLLPDEQHANRLSQSLREFLVELEPIKKKLATMVKNLDRSRIRRSCDALRWYISREDIVCGFFDRAATWNSIFMSEVLALNMSVGLYHHQSALPY